MWSCVNSLPCMIETDLRRWDFSWLNAWNRHHLRIVRKPFLWQNLAYQNNFSWNLPDENSVVTFKMFPIMPRAHTRKQSVSWDGQEGGRKREKGAWMRTLYVCSRANTSSLFWKRLITSDSNLFLFRKYTNHLQVLFASVFSKLSWQAQMFWVYIKWENERVWIRFSVCTRAATGVAGEGGRAGAGKAAGADAGFGTRGRLVKQVQSHLCAEW